MATRTRKPAAPPAPPPPPPDFDESTPPPRLATPRPTGEPIPPWIELPAAASPAAVYLDWLAAGRIPAGSVLAEHVGTACGLERHSGYRIRAVPDGGTRTIDRAAGGGPVPDPVVRGFAVRVVIREKGRPTPALVILSPAEAA